MMNRRVEQLLECWDRGAYRDVMLPGMPHMTCGEFVVLLRSDIAASDDAMIERCAVADEMQDRVGHEWVKDSLWDTICRRFGAAVRALKIGNEGKTS